MEGADVVVRAGGGSGAPGRVGGYVTRVENAGGRRGMRHEVVVVPAHGVADVDGKRARLEAEIPDRHLLCARRAVARRAQQEESETLHEPSLVCKSCAAFKCCSKAGRTFTSSALSSAFCALGMSVLSSALSTAVWYVTSFAIYALSKSAPVLAPIAALAESAAVLSAWLVGLSAGVRFSLVASALASLFTAV